MSVGAIATCLGGIIGTFSDDVLKCFTDFKDISIYYVLDFFSFLSWNSRSL